MAGTKEDIFEQMVRLTLSEQYGVIKGLVKSLVDGVKYDTMRGVL